MAKGKKKSLVAYIPSRGFQAFKFSKECKPNRIEMPWLFRSPRIWIKLKRKYIKVRITIEEE
jgi:hypothetical protein